MLLKNFFKSNSHHVNISATNTYFGDVSGKKLEIFLKFKKKDAVSQVV